MCYLYKLFNLVINSLLGPLKSFTSCFNNPHMLTPVSAVVSSSVPRCKTIMPVDKRKILRQLGVYNQLWHDSAPAAAIVQRLVSPFRPGAKRHDVSTRALSPEPSYTPS